MTQSEFETTVEIRENEAGRGVWKTPKIVCCECGEVAQGNGSCEGGELCDSCLQEGV